MPPGARREPPDVAVSVPEATEAVPTKIGGTNYLAIRFARLDLPPGRVRRATGRGLYTAAANRYRRRMVSFRTELEKLIPTYGDPIAIATTCPAGARAGRRSLGIPRLARSNCPSRWSGPTPRCTSSRCAGAMER